jgi:hypothetical protein
LRPFSERAFIMLTIADVLPEPNIPDTTRRRIVTQ